MTQMSQFVQNMLAVSVECRQALDSVVNEGPPYKANAVILVAAHF